MTKIGILYFSTTAPTQMILDAPNTKMIPLPCTVDGKTYVTGEITLKEYIDVCMNQKVAPKTSQPSPGEIRDVLSEMQNEYENIFIITAKHDLTGVYNGCSLAIDMLNKKDNIILIDTFSMAMGECVAIEYILKLQNSLEPLEIKQRVIELIDSYTTYAFPGSMKYLKISGRVSGTSAFVGEMIKLKTGIKVHRDVAQGVIDLKGRGYKSVFKYIEKQIDLSDATHACITDIYCDPKVIEEVKEIILAKGLKFKETMDADIVVATHFGPQSFGIVLYKER